MKAIRRAAVAVFILSILGSCTGSPEVLDPSGADISFRRLTTGELLRYSIDKGLNPYFHDGFMRRPEEILVLGMSVRTGRSLGFELGRLHAYDKEGMQIAEFLDRESYLTFLERWTTDPADFTRLKAEVRRTYLPFGELGLRPGKRDYILVLVGKRPLPEAVRLSGLVFIDGATRDVDFDLSAAKR